jgi:hypothetical protein
MNALVAPSRLLPLVGGVIIALWSFQLLFVLAAGTVVARLVILARLPIVRPRPVATGATP